MVKINNALLKTSWKKSLLFIKSYFYNTLVNKSSFVPLRGFLGDYIDLETAYIFKKFLSLNGSGFFVNAGSNSADHSLLYFFNTPLSKLQDSDICVLVDVNLRMVMPLINSRIRQLVTKKMLPVFVLGFHSNFNFFVKHVSSSSKALPQVLEGSH